MSKQINTFAGLNGFVWWVGRIVLVDGDAVDPLAIGRYRVRIFGWHTDNKSLLPDKDLPWAHPMFSINNSKSWSPLEPDSWVMGFFMDGESGQFPIIMGFLPGINNMVQG